MITMKFGWQKCLKEVKRWSLELLWLLFSFPDLPVWQTPKVSAESRLGKNPNLETQFIPQLNFKEKKNIYISKTRIWRVSNAATLLVYKCSNMQVNCVNIYNSPFWNEMFIMYFQWRQIFFVFLLHVSQHKLMS